MARYDRDPTDLGLTDPKHLVPNWWRPPAPPRPRPPTDAEPAGVPSQRSREHMTRIAAQMGWGAPKPRRCDHCRGTHERGEPHTRPWRVSRT